MPGHIPAPSASDSPQDLADWLELHSLGVDDRSSSIQDLAQELRRAGTTDAVGDPDAATYRGDAGGEVSQVLAEGAFNEIDRRSKACGGEEGNYPFTVLDYAFQLKEGMETHPYVFMLLLSRFGYRAGPNGSDGAKLFEDMCAAAAESYFGGPHPLVKSHVFGFPRRILPPGFGGALDLLCTNLGEGGGHRRRPTSSNQKDAKLDIVVWRDFHGKEGGKLIGFGQCATGEGWKEKTTELLDPAQWCVHWMNDPPTVTPIRLFFVPHRISNEDWSITCRSAGILFDRIRIAQHVNSLAPQLQARCNEWAQYVLAAKVLKISDVDPNES